MIPKIDLEKENEQAVYQVIGTRPIRHDGTDKVTGRALYGIDTRQPGMLYGAVLRSPHAHARILSIDTRQAEAFPGVKAVVTSADLPDIESRNVGLGEGASDPHYQSSKILARDKVLHYGHAIAAVAATNVHIARKALELIQVEFEILPAVLDVRQAMQPGAPILLENLRTEEFGHKGSIPTNIAAHVQAHSGDIQRGFQDAAIVIEREFFTDTVHQGYIEPQNAMALYQPDGHLTIWCSTQGAFGVRDQVAELLDIPVSMIRVIPMEIGGGFGGKIGVYLEPVAALLSKKSGHRPVKMTMSYAEVLAGTGPTSGSYIRVKMGANRKGLITAAEAYLAYEAGAYPGSPIWGGMSVIFAPYRIENLLIDAYDVVVNKPQTAAYRAPGGTNAAFASETVIDELALKLGLDPVEFRLLNCVREGDRNRDGVKYQRIGLVEVLQAVKDHPHYSSPLQGSNQGRGVAIGAWSTYGGKSSASASVNSDGRVALVEGSTDIGGTRTSIAMQLAETLQIPVGDVQPQVADTDSVGYTEGTYGSRTTFATGWAAYELGRILVDQLCQRAAGIWETEPSQVRFSEGVFSTTEKSMTFKELAKELEESGGPVVASVSVQPPGMGAAFAAHIVDVEVDPDTGKVDILRYTAVQDAGKAIHPAYVEGQMQGGAAQGAGWALSEGYFYDPQGHLLNASLLDYRVPTCLDLPRIETVIVEAPNPQHPYGVRGVGEVPIIPPAAAIANGIFRAAAVRLNRLPMAPARVLEALLRK